jgi:hypothetical protein
VFSCGKEVKAKKKWQKRIKMKNTERQLFYHRKENSMKKTNLIKRTGSNLKRALLAAFCLAMLYGVPTMAHADWYSWLRRWPW